jgi:hypothetical protein
MADSGYNCKQLKYEDHFVNSDEMKGFNYNLSRGLDYKYFKHLMTKSKMAIPIPRTAPFPSSFLHLAKPGERNAAPRLLNVHEESPTVTPALKSMQGRLIIWRGPHGILWL